MLHGTMIIVNGGGGVEIGVVYLINSDLAVAVQVKLMSQLLPLFEVSSCVSSVKGKIQNVEFSIAVSID